MTKPASTDKVYMNYQHMKVYLAEIRTRRVDGRLWTPQEGFLLPSKAFLLLFERSETGDGLKIQS